MTYLETEKIIKELQDLKLPSVFNFKETPLEYEFEKIFDFYSITLKNFSNYGLKPALIYFNNRTSVNALACKRKEYFIVSFNCGTIVHLVDTFEKIKFKTSNPFLDSLLDSSVNKLMYQVCLHFTLYHEMAHLIQNSSYLTKGLYELQDSERPFDINRHLLEFDADQFSSICIGSHICDYLDRIDDSKDNRELEEHVLTIAIASLMVYILSFNPNNEEIYYEKNNHPHPSIRLSIITQTLIDYTYQFRRKRSSQRKEKTNMIVNAGNIVQNGTNSNIVLNYILAFSENYKKIKGYIEKFVLTNNKDIQLATDKWNEISKQMKDELS